MQSCFPLATNGRELEEIVESFPAEGASSNAIHAALACLVKAGLLMRPGEQVHVPVCEVSLYRLQNWGPRGIRARGQLVSRCWPTVRVV